MRATAITLALALVTVRCVPAASRPAPASMPLVAEARLIRTAADDSAPELLFGSFVLPVTIHGKTVQVIADYGSSASMLTDSAFQRIGQPHYYASATRADTIVRHNGLGRAIDSTANEIITRGDSTFEYWGDFAPATLDSLRIGAASLDHVMIVKEAAAVFLDPFDGLLGRDILSAYDLVFDFRAGSLRFYQRLPGVRGQSPALPRGIAASDCARATVVEHMGVDTAGMDADDRKEISANPGKRMWDQEELYVPLVVNGSPLEGHFDSGAGGTVMNWAEAQALGITRGSSAVTPYWDRGLAMFNFRDSRPSPGDSLLQPYRDSTFQVAGVNIRIAGRRLPADTIFISDPTFHDIPSFRTKPILMVGMKQFRGRVLFLSHSTGTVCVG